MSESDENVRSMTRRERKRVHSLFVKTIDDDRERGRLKPLAEYLRLFPGDDVGVARRFLEYSDERSSLELATELRNGRGSRTLLDHVMDLTDEYEDVEIAREFVADRLEWGQVGEDLIPLPGFMRSRLSIASPGKTSCNICERRSRQATRADFWVYHIAAKPSVAEGTICGSCQRDLTKLWPPTGALFRALETDIARSTARLLSFDARLHFIDPPWDASFQRELFVLIREARWAFLLGLHAAATTLISAAVEVALNLDLRLNNGKWKTLGIKSLNEARADGCPVDELLESEERKSRPLTTKPRFVQRRNKVAHGELPSDYIRAFFNSNAPEKESAAQLEMGQAFLMSWATTNRNPMLGDDALRWAGHTSALAIEFPRPL